LESQTVGRALIAFGIILVVVGGLFFFSDRLPFLKSIGRLPGDMNYSGKNWSVHFPLMTSLLLSVGLSAIFWIISYFRNRGGQ
jgi:Protein of unknown function (DUF2905)